MINEKKEGIGQIEKLKQFLPEKTQEELEQILAYGERIKVRGEEKKREWWKKNSKHEFGNLLRYMLSNEKKVEKDYEYLGKLNKIEREKFIEEFLYSDMLYSGKIDRSIKGEQCSYNRWKEGKAVIEVGMNLFFYHNHIGDEGAKTIAENLKLKEFVILSLGDNEIGDEGAKAIAKNMELKEGVSLKLQHNHIGVKGVEALSEMKLKQGVTLYLRDNEIGDEGAKAISKMELKGGVTLSLGVNEIGNEGAKAIAENMELQEGVTLDFHNNKIGDGGAIALSKMKLEEGFYLNLENNQIGDEGAKAMIKNMELKDGCILHLSGNNISEEMEKKLIEWEQSYVSRGIKCEVKI